MLKTQGLVHRFMRTMGLPLPNEVGLSIEGLKKLNFPLLRKLVREEAKEFRDWMIELEERLQDHAPESEVLEAWAQVIDAMCDTIVVVHNTSNAMGIDLEPFFDEVQRSNMAKAGGPKDADGKQLKPEGWEPPRILSLLSGALASPLGYSSMAEHARTFFVITEHEFDSMENHTPWRDEVVAVAEDAMESARVIDALKVGRNNRKCWDGRVYPYWSVKEVPNGSQALARLPEKVVVREEAPTCHPIGKPPGCSKGLCENCKERLPPLKFKIGDRVTVHLNDEQGRVPGVVTEARRCQPYPPGFGPTHGVMVSAVLDCNVVTGLMPESAFEFEKKVGPVHVGVDMGEKPSEAVWAKVEVEGGEVKKVERLHPPFEVGDRVSCTFNEALGEEGVVRVLEHRTNSEWYVRVEMLEEARRAAFDGFLPATLFQKTPEARSVRVVCDETNNPPEKVAQGIATVDVYMRSRDSCYCGGTMEREPYPFGTTIFRCNRCGCKEGRPNG